MGRGGYSKGRAAKGKPRDTVSEKDRKGDRGCEASNDDCANVEDISGQESGNSSDGGGEDSGVDECESKTNNDLQVKLVIFEFAQNDPKVDSGYKMTRMGIARAIKPTATFHGVILSPRSQTPVSAVDRECLLSYGLAGINASWNRMEELPWSRLQKHGRHRILPNLLAANAINYGRPMKLNTAEAMAATLLIAGLDDAAKTIMQAFSWGDEFLKINLERFVAYSSARDPADVRRRELELQARMDAERAERKANTEMDLPPSESEDEENDDDCEAQEPTEQQHSRSLEEEAAFSSIWEVYYAAKKAEEEERAVKEKEVETEERRRNEVRAEKSVCKSQIEVEPSPKAKTKPQPPTTVEPPVAVNDSNASVAPNVVIAADHPAPLPKDMKIALSALQTTTSMEFQKNVGLVGLSGNALAKFKRPEFEALWRRFCIEEAPRLTADQARAILAPESSVQAPKGGPKKR